MPDLVVGSTIAGCQLEAVAGRGGMGVVYRATQLGLGRPVAVKAMSSELAQDADYRERFQRESQIAASIDHPNIIPVYEAGELEGTLYLIMRWVDGTDLRTLLRSSGRLTPRHAIRLLRPLAAALSAAHRSGLVHRDIKPANVLIAPGESKDDEHAYLTDFGIARRTDGESAMTRTGVFVGTLDYTAPERIEGGKGDAASDIYSFGCMLFETLTGHVPFVRPSEVAKMFAHINDAVPAARAEVDNVPELLDAVIAKAMAKHPEDRFGSATEIASALSDVLREMETEEHELRRRLARPDAPRGETAAAEPTVRSAEPTIPSAEPTIPSAGPTVPSTGPTIPSAEPTIPSAGPTIPRAPATTVPAGRAATVPGDPGAARPRDPAGATTERRERPPQPRGRRRALLLVGPIALLVVIAAVVVLATSGGGGAGGGTASVPTGPVRPAAASAVSISGAGLSEGRSIALGAPPAALSVGPSGNLWASLPSSGAIVRVGALAGRARTYAIGGHPAAIAVAPDGLWVSGAAAGPLARFNLQSGRVEATAQLATPPLTMAVDSADGSVWTAEARGAVTHLDSGGAPLGTPATVSPAPVSMAVGEGWLWAVNGAPLGLVRIGGSGSPTTFDARADPVAVALDQGVWTAHTNGHVTRFDPRPGHVQVNTDTLIAPEPLDAIAAIENQPSVWAISRQARALFRISTATGAPVTGKVVFGSPPVALAVSDHAVWVGTQAGNVIELLM